MRRPGRDLQPGLGVTAGSIPRALDLIRALAAEASYRGHRVGVNTKTKHPKVYLQIGQTRRSMTLTEEYDQIRHVPTDQELRELRRSPWRKSPEYDTVPSGRLRLDIARAGWNNHDTWVDDKRTPLEKRLQKIIREVEKGLIADEEARLAAQKAAEEAAAEHRRRKEEQRRRWEAAMADARVKAVERLRQTTFRNGYDAWVPAGEIRAFCTALDEAGQAADRSDHAENLARWSVWGRAAADRIDPVHGGSSLAEVSFDVKPGPGDLRPFLGEWSPNQPVREYRSERDEQRLADVRLQATSWHHGMRGRPSWWRK